MPEGYPATGFPTTQWTLVTRAGGPANPAARAALETLYRDYWFPLYALACRRGLDGENAADLVQGFLADLIERRDLAIVDRTRGRFRTFLWTAFVHFMAHQRDHDRALKRGGGRRCVPIDMLEAEGRYGSEPAHELTAERLFERRWALELLDRVLSRLEAEAAVTKAGLFRHLKPILEGGEIAESYRAIGNALGMTEGAVKAAAHRLRSRYRQLLREEVGRTVCDPAEIDAEITELLSALA
jgi:DNA-directed RNA polymerase specialized sigma24 family protein